MEKTRTRWDIIIDDIKLGDIIYECDYGWCIKAQVTSAPVLKDGYWSWKAVDMITGKEIDYWASQGNEYNHYSLKLYSYQAYTIIR